MTIQFSPSQVETEYTALHDLRLDPKRAREEAAQAREEADKWSNDMEDKNLLARYVCDVLESQVAQGSDSNALSRAYAHRNAVVEALETNDPSDATRRYQRAVNKRIWESDKHCKQLGYGLRSRVLKILPNG